MFASISCSDSVSRQVCNSLSHIDWRMGMGSILQTMLVPIKSPLHQLWYLAKITTLSKCVAILLIHNGAKLWLLASGTPLHVNSNAYYIISCFFFLFLPINPASFYINISVCCAAIAEGHREKLLYANSAHCEVELFSLLWLILQFKYASVCQLVFLNHNPSEIKLDVHL